MTTWAIFYFDGNYNSSCIVEDPEDKLEAYEDWASSFPELFVVTTGKEAEITGIIDITGATNPRMCLGNDWSCNTFINLKAKQLP